MDKQQVKKLALDNGFKLKQQPNGEMDLNPYVYEFAAALTAKANERVAKLECENINGNAAAELLIWWAQKLNNAPNEDLKEVIRIGYKRIVNLANLIGEEQLRKEQEK